MIILIFILSFLILTRFNIDPDLGWHLAIGRHFWQAGETGGGDIFSWTMPGYEWGNYFFLYQILVSWLFDNLGYLVTVFIFGLISSVAILILMRRKISLIAGLVVVLAVAIVSVSSGVRPSVFSLLFFGVLLVFLERNLFSGRRGAVFWLLFFALWANFHQGFVVGLLVFLGYRTLTVLIKKSKGDIGRSIIQIILAAAGTMLTPFGTDLYKSIFWDLVGKNTWVAIAEYQPIAIFFPINFLYALSGLILIYILFMNFKKGDAVVWLLMGAFLFCLGFLGTSLSIFWCLALVFLATRYLDIRLTMPRDRLARLPIITSTGCAVLALILAFFVNLLEAASLQMRLVKDGYPVRAVQFLKESGYGENLFNLYHWGGYLVWQAPEVKVFIDGRMTGWKKADGGYILADYLAILAGDCALARQYQIQTVLVASNNSNVCFEQFGEVWRDSIAKILVR